MMKANATEITWFDDLMQAKMDLGKMNETR